MPTEKAHGYQIAKMCESFAAAGADVRLIVPKRINSISDNVFDYYKLKENFKIKYLNSFDFFKWEKIIGSKLSFYLQSLFFSFKVKNLKVESDGIMISRNPEIVQAFADKNIKTFYDAHRWPVSKNAIFKKMLKNCSGVICNSNGTAEKFRENGFKNILVAPNGVDLSEYNVEKTKKELRNNFNLPIDKKIIMYVGHLYKWKGVDLVLELSKMHQGKNVLFVFVGGTQKDINKYKNKAKEMNIKNILFLGHRKKEDIPGLQMSADVLLLPNIAVSIESEKYTSPIKMFEYMASGVPIAAADLPSIREVLNKKNSILFRAGDIDSFNNQLENLIDNKIDVENIVKQAKIDVQKYSWLARAEKIINFVS